MPGATAPSFLFSFLGSQPVHTARAVHIRRLYDILLLSLQTDDYRRAQNAYAILLRCKEIDWKELWKLGVYLLGKQDVGRDVEFLRAMLLQHPNEREAIMQELVLALVRANCEREALDELELYLPSFPYQDNPALHTYAGIICIHLAGQEREQTPFTSFRLRIAQGYFERARQLDPENGVAQAFLEKVRIQRRI
ncbi:hypothetical protein K488DRAFT_54031 [Vararia minispora EC-137]|uniref:Uncharacterized protein n=1 Tax=Vararia minispora EC-137 TaxID=1314806 RepID=A0ACB8QFF2_9AGAM|nr:hypothetical protein K488DRAFT_54031 [Vararia minispora EC-137]